LQTQEKGMHIRKLTLGLGAAAISVAALGAIPAMGADHRDAPLSKGAPQADINDVYAFKSPAGNYVALMTVNPLTSPADTGKLSLATDVVYELKLDLDENAVADRSYKFTFSGTGPVQDVTVRLASGANAVTNDPTGDIIATGKTSSGSGVTVIEGAGGRKFYIGPRDDPFFFDLAGFQDGLKFTGVDTFKGTNITAILMELPASVVSAAAPDGTLGVWATTSKSNGLGAWTQIDRMGRPAINTVFIPAEMKDAFNSNNPDRDVEIYTDTVKASLDSLASPSTDALAGLLLPDILTIDMNMAVGYLNGRDLDDDVIDISLQAITGNNAAGDMVNANDKGFSTAFPYLAAPHGQAAPGAPNTGSGLAATESGSDLGWTLPAGLIAAAALLGAAGYAQRRRPAATGR
jgi:hypothetical protein